jgi:hypothetical protein
VTIDGGNLTKVLTMFAAWRPCRSCGARVLYVDEDARPDGDFICGLCEERQDLIRVLLFLRPANDQRPLALDFERLRNTRVER